MKQICVFLSFLLGSLLVLSSAGCGGGQTADSPEALHVTKVGEMCDDFAKAKKAYPTSMEELQQWAVENGRGQEKDFKSLRDGEPYVLRATRGARPMIHEAKGKDGKKYVYYPPTGKAAEMDNEGVEYLANPAAGMGKPVLEQKRKATN
jgi:hypothetical protein